MLGADGTCDVTQAYVSLVDEGDALMAALALHARADTAHVPVTVAVADADAGIAILVESEHGRFAAISAFGVLSKATSHELLLRGTNELLARAQHAEWLRNERAKGTRSEENPNMKPWEELGDAQREDNRRFADDLHEKLSLIHCMLVPMPLPDPDDPPFTFTPDDLELLAQHEHTRWMNARLEAGWRYGVPRDDAKKIHDQIKPWEQLDQDNREKDRNAVREIPDMLALAGYRIRNTT
jgi:RyR domain